MFGDEDATPVSMRTRVEEFLRFVEEHRDGWRVLWREANASRPVAEEVAGSCGRRSSTRCSGSSRRGRRRAPAPSSRGATETAAHAIVGAGESLANWWLEHPEVSAGRSPTGTPVIVQAHGGRGDRRRGRRRRYVRARGPIRLGVTSPPTRACEEASCSSLLDLTVQGDVATISDETKLPEVKLMEPLALYRLWERQNWVLARDRPDSGPGGLGVPARPRCATR